MIRPFEATDHEAIAEIYAASKLDELRFESRKFELLPLASDHRRREALMESEIFLFEQTAAIAFGAVHRNEIRGLFVQPDHRGRGIGRALLEAERRRARFVARRGPARRAPPPPIGGDVPLHCRGLGAWALRPRRR